MRDLFRRLRHAVKRDRFEADLAEELEFHRAMKQRDFEDAGLETRVRRITTEELGRPAPRPAYSVLRSEKPETPVLPNWREGLSECLARIG